MIDAVAALHAWPGGLAHGAINPAHVLLTHDGRIVLTDCVFGTGLEVVQPNREQLWKDYGLAMPAVAGLARFDQPADVWLQEALQIHPRLAFRSAKAQRSFADIGGTSGRRSGAMALQEFLRTAIRLDPSRRIPWALTESSRLAPVLGG